MLLVYPFQVALAMADRCCVTTPAGLSHHGAAQGGSLETVQTVVLDDDAAPGRADPHCPACVFGQIASLPAKPGLPPVAAPHGVAIASTTPFLTCVPGLRPERPNWPAAA